MKKVISLILCVLLVLSPLAVAASAADFDKPVTIFVDGLNTCDVFNTKSNEQIIPPSGDAILGQVTGNLGPIIASVLTGNYHIMEDELFEALDVIFGPMLCDENGRGIDTRNGYQIPTEDEIREFVESRDPAASPDDNYIRFTYNWCESIQNIAADLRTLIERVVAVTGEDVALIGFSMGTCVVASYLKMYDYEYVDSVVLLAGAYNGVSCCGEPFSYQLGTDSDAIVRFVESLMTGNDATNVFLRNLMLLLNKQGILDFAVDKIVWRLVEQLGDRVYDEAMPKIFARLPGLWSLVSLKDYPAARALIVKSGMYDDEYLAMLDWYHNEVQVNMESLLQGCLDRGIHLGIVAKYGFANVPVIPDYNRMSDTVISSCDEAYGATFADVGSTLGDGYTQAVQNGHNCLSPDNMVDSSTCTFCDYTWFVKNLTHARMPDCVFELSDYIINAKAQPTVWDGTFSQFLVFTPDETLETLNAENDYSIYTAAPRSTNVFKLFFNTVKSLFGLLKK